MSEGGRRRDVRFRATVCGRQRKGRGKDGRPFLSFPVRAGDHTVRITVRGGRVREFQDAVFPGAELWLDGRLRSVLYLSVRDVEPVRWQRFRGRVVKEAKDDDTDSTLARATV